MMLWWMQVEDKRVVLDDIDWGAVAKAIGTRNHAQCMERWYKCQVCASLMPPHAERVHSVHGVAVASFAEGRSKGDCRASRAHSARWCALGALATPGAVVQSPSMVERGVWGVGDDRGMLQRMVESRATQVHLLPPPPDNNAVRCDMKVQHPAAFQLCVVYRPSTCHGHQTQWLTPHLQEWELDWGALVPNRTANQARRRWTLMLKHVESVNDREFTERLLVLVS